MSVNLPSLHILTCAYKYFRLLARHKATDKFTNSAAGEQKITADYQNPCQMHSRTVDARRRGYSFATATYCVSAGRRDMTNTWLLNAIGLYATTIGALLIWLQLLSPSPYADELQTPEAKRQYARHRRQLVIAVGLLCLWLVVQDLAVLLL
jgi:hypothetical protein